MQFTPTQTLHKDTTYCCAVTIATMCNLPNLAFTKVASFPW